MTPQEQREALRAEYAARTGNHAAKVVADMPLAFTDGVVLWSPNLGALAGRPGLLAGAEQPTHQVSLAALLACPRVVPLPDLDCHEHDATECSDCAGAGVVECDLGHEHECEECAGRGKRPCAKCGSIDAAYPHDGEIGARLVLLAGCPLDGAQLWRAIQCLDGGDPHRLVGVARGEHKIVMFDGAQVVVVSEVAGREPALAAKIEVAVKAKR